MTVSRTVLAVGCRAQLSIVQGRYVWSVSRQIRILGLPLYQESEGPDRADLTLPPGCGERPETAQLGRCGAFGRRSPYGLLSFSVSDPADGARGKPQLAPGGAFALCEAAVERVRRYRRRIGASRAVASPASSSKGGYQCKMILPRGSPDRVAATAATLSGEIAPYIECHAQHLREFVVWIRLFD
jgi:hypothetical protein